MVFSTWWSWLLVILVLGTVAMILFAGRRGVKDPGAVAGHGMVRTTRRIAWIFVAVSAIAGLAEIIRTIWQDVVTVKLPVQQFWPTLPDNVTMETPLAPVEYGGFTWAMVGVSGLELDARLMLAGAVLSQVALAVVVGLTVVRLCSSLLCGTLFAPQLVRTMQQLAGVTLLAGIAWQVFQTIGGSIASEQVLGAAGWRLSSETITYTDIQSIIGLPSVSYAWEFNFWPVGAALALIVLAELFRQGNKVQKDTAGLV